MTQLRSHGPTRRPDVPANDILLSEPDLRETVHDDIARTFSGIFSGTSTCRGSSFQGSTCRRPSRTSSGPASTCPPSTSARPSLRAAAAAHIGGHSRRPRWPLAVAGLVVAGLAGWAILSQEAQRARLTRGARAIRERISAIRSDLQGRPEVHPGHAIAFSAADSAPIDTSPFTDGSTVEGTGYPAALGSNGGDGTPVTVEVSSPA